MYSWGLDSSSSGDGITSHLEMWRQSQSDASKAVPPEPSVAHTLAPRSTVELSQRGQSIAERAMVTNRWRSATTRHRLAPPTGRHRCPCAHPFARSAPTGSRWRRRSWRRHRSGPCVGCARAGAGGGWGPSASAPATGPRPWYTQTLGGSKEISGAYGPCVSSGYAASGRIAMSLGVLEIGLALCIQSVSALRHVAQQAPERGPRDARNAADLSALVSPNPANIAEIRPSPGRSRPPNLGRSRSKSFEFRVRAKVDRSFDPKRPGIGQLLRNRQIWIEFGFGSWMRLGSGSGMHESHCRPPRAMLTSCASPSKQQAAGLAMVALRRIVSIARLAWLNFWRPFCASSDCGVLGACMHVRGSREECARRRRLSGLGIACFVRRSAAKAGTKGEEWFSNWALFFEQLGVALSRTRPLVCCDVGGGSGNVGAP